MPLPRPAPAVLIALVVMTWNGRAPVGARLAATQPAPAPITWQPQASGVTVRLRGVSAVSAEVAWASEAGGRIARLTFAAR